MSRQTVEDSSYPYETAFSLDVGDTVILRARALDTSGQGSIWAANMIHVVDPSQLQCGDYESALTKGDLNKDCRVDLSDFSEFLSCRLECDDPQPSSCS